MELRVSHANLSSLLVHLVNKGLLRARYVDSNVISCVICGIHQHHHDQLSECRRIVRGQTSNLRTFFKIWNCDFTRLIKINARIKRHNCSHNLGNGCHRKLLIWVFAPEDVSLCIGDNGCSCLSKFWLIGYRRLVRRGVFCQSRSCRSKRSS